MRKTGRFLLFTMMVLFCTKAWAVDVITSGNDYYIQNVESGLFLCGANDWGTKASVATEGALFNLTGSDNVYPIKHLGTGTYLGKDLYTDQGALNPGWTISPVDGKTGVFTIYNSTKGYLAQGDKAAKGNYAVGAADVTESAYWRILTKEEAISQLDGATKDNGKNASFLISNPGFNRNVSTAKWTVSADCTAKNLSGGDTKSMAVNYCAESYRSKFTISQTLTNIPNGDYRVTVQAFYRQDGTDTEHLPMLFANNEEQVFGVMPTGVGSMADAANKFQSGTDYVIGVDVTVTNGTLELGVRTENNMLWCLWDNFELTYYGLDLTTFKTTFQSALANAKAINQESPMNKNVLAALNTAISTYDGKSYSTVEDYSAAIDALNTAIDNAKASIGIYAKVKQLNDKVDSYDDAGKAAYKTTLEAYTDRTLENYEDALAAFVAAAKAQTTVGSDMTDAILNPSFEEAFTSWTNTGNMAIQNNSDFGKEGVYYAEFYKPKGTKGVSQTIKGLRKGLYKLKVHVLARGIKSGNVFINSTKTAFVIDQQKDYEVMALVDGDAEIGVTAEGNDGANGSWFAVDNFTLTYLGAELDITLASSGMSTFSSQYEFKVPEGLEAYYAESCDGEVVKMKKLENGIIPAETGVVLMGAGGEDYIVTLSATGAEAVEDNLLIAATTSVELPATTDGNKNYVLVEGMFHPYTGTAHVGAGKAYLQLNENPEVKSLMLDFCSADGIADIANDKAATNEEYSLLGTRISNGYKGIVIKNGKKILRK